MLPGQYACRLDGGPARESPGWSAPGRTFMEPTYTVFTPPPPRPRTHRPGTFVLLAAAVFVEAVGIGVLFPLLARIQAAHHLPTYGLGLMSGASFFASLLGQVGVARFLDGRRARPVLLGALILAGVGPLWFALAGDLWTFTAARAVGGVAYGVVMPAALRAGTAGVPAADRGTRLGYISSAQMAGIVFGPLAGVALYAAGGLALPFEAVAAAQAMILVALLLTPGAGAVTGAAPASEVEGDTTPASDPAPPTAARPRLGSPAVVAVLLVAVASQLPNGFYDALWSRLLTDRGASTVLIGLSLALFGIPFVILAPLGGRLAGRRAPLPWAAGGLVVAACFMASYGTVGAPVLIVVLGVFESCAQAIVVPGGYAATAAVFPEAFAATGQGWSSGAGTAAAGTAAVVAAPAYAAFGPAPVFAGGALVSALCAAVAVAIWRRPRTPGRLVEPSLQ